MGCLDASACNYNFAATDNKDSTCIYAAGCDTCSGEQDGSGSVVDRDADDDGTCDDLDECPNDASTALATVYYDPENTEHKYCPAQIYNGDVPLDQHLSPYAYECNLCSL